MKLLYSIIAVLMLAAVALAGWAAPGLHALFAVIIPYAAIVIFLVGISWRIIRWSASPVPFRTPTTAGQQRSLAWLPRNRFDNPYTTTGVIGRMLLEVLLFRSLFRNTRAELRPGPQLAYGEEKFLWLGALAFHWSFLFIFLRHLRFFLTPVPAFVTLLHTLDGFFEVGAPGVYATDVVIILALGYLLWRRIGQAQIRYLSLFTDYFALCLLLGLAVSGVLMRYFTKVDIVAAKQLALGLVTFSPVVPEGVGALLFVHLFLLSALLAYFPFSKLVHMGGVFLTPTRNLANNNRAKRHINVWNCPVKVHTYEEWEDEFREKMKAAGLPIEKN